MEEELKREEESKMEEPTIIKETPKMEEEPIEGTESAKPMEETPMNPQTLEETKDVPQAATGPQVEAFDEVGFDHAYGAVIGAFIGDGLGAPIEFETHEINKNIIDDIMNLCYKGYGAHGTATGQITDDSEMAMSLAHGLGRTVETGIMNVSEITRFYGLWCNRSDPFDVGYTTGTALTWADHKKPDGELVQRNSKKNNRDSQSNGSLMRITPLCVYIHRLNELADVQKAIIEDTSLTHPHPNIHELAIAYALAVKSLINDHGNADSAYQIAFDYVKNCGNTDVQGWFQSIDKDEKMGCHHQMGWARIGVHYAFKYLKEKRDFDDAMRDILRRGGDTDTNAAIVGGMMGAFHGYNKLPENMKKACENVVPRHGVGIHRPNWLIPKFFIRKLITQIYTYAPSTLQVSYTPLSVPTQEDLLIDNLNDYDRLFRSHTQFQSILI